MNFDTLDLKERLGRIADRYRGLGYHVILHPGPDDLPAFARDFKVEFVATSDTSNVLASAKANGLELEADTNLKTYAEVTEKQPQWRFELFVLGPVPKAPWEMEKLEEMTENEIRERLDAVGQIAAMGFPEQAFVAAWSVLEATMRIKLRELREPVGTGVDAQSMIGQLASNGGIATTSRLRELEQMLVLRNALVHGFAPQVDIGNDVVIKALQIAREFLGEHQPAMQTA